MQTQSCTFRFQSYTPLLEIAQLRAQTTAAFRLRSRQHTYQVAILMHSLNIYVVSLLHSIVHIASLGVKLAFHTSCMFAQMKSVQLSFLALHNPAFCHLQYLSFTNDLYLGKNMPPTDLHMSVKLSDWKPSSLLYTS